MSSANLPVPQKPEQAPWQDQALLEIDFSFDLAPVVKYWKNMETEEKKPLVMDQMNIEFPRFTLKVDDKPLRLPEPEEERQATNYFDELKSRNPKFASLLEKSSDLIYFFAQQTGIKLSCAPDYAFPVLGEGSKIDQLMPQLKEGPNRQIAVENTERAIFLRCTSRKKGQHYSLMTDMGKTSLILTADESIWQLPLDAKGKLTGKAIVHGTLLLQNPDGQSSDEFRRVINLQTTRTHHAIEELGQLGSGKVEVKKKSTFLSPPTKASRVAWPALSTGVLAGAALVATMVFAVAPPLGLGLVAATLIMAGIGALIGLGINALRTRNYESAVKKHESAVALAFGRAVEGPVVSVSLDGPQQGAIEQKGEATTPVSTPALPSPKSRRNSEGNASPTAV